MAKPDPTIKALVGLILWPGFILAIIGVYFGYQILLFIAGAALSGIAAFLVRRRRKRAVAIEVPEFKARQVPKNLNLSDVYLTLEPGQKLRVVDIEANSDAFKKIAREYEVEEALEVILDGHLFAHVVDGSVYSISVLRELEVLGRLPKVETPLVAEQMLRSGGSARVKIGFRITPAGTPSNVRILPTVTT